MNRRELEADNQNLRQKAVQQGQIIKDQQNELDLRANEIDRRLRTLGEQARELAVLRSGTRVQDIRLVVLQNSPYAAPDELDKKAKWVLTGEVPIPTEGEVGEKLVDFPVKGEMAEGPRPPEIRRDSLLTAIAALRVVSDRMTDLRKDPAITAGKVRIQHTGDRIKGILLDLEAIVEGQA